MSTNSKLNIRDKPKWNIIIKKNKIYILFFYKIFYVITLLKIVSNNYFIKDINYLQNKNW